MVGNKKIFPMILIALQALAGVESLCHGDIKMTVYWIAAAVLNAAVTI